MDDIARHDAAPHDSQHTLSLEEVMQQLVAAGVPRSKRHVQRLCEGGLFDAKKLPGGSGDEWFIAPASVSKAVGDLRAIQERRDRHGRSQRAMSDPAVQQTLSKTDADLARHDAPERAASDLPKEEVSTTQTATSRYVTLLERDNEFLREQVTKKDEQIGDLSKRFADTQSLLGAMQRMFAPLLGQADPFVTIEKREANDRPN